MSLKFIFNKNILIFTLIVFFSKQLHSQSLNKKIQFEHLSIEEGLSHSTVFSIIQDSKGFMWFGTLDGLNKYDGYSFKVYKSNPFDKSSLSNNIVFKVFEDKDKNIWIGTLGGGLNKFDRTTEKFTQYRYSSSDTNSISDDNIRTIFQDSKGRLWIGTNNGLNLFDAEKNLFKRFFHNKNSKNSLSSNYIWSIYESRYKPGILWIGTYNGLNYFDVEKKLFKTFLNSKYYNYSISNNYVWSITGIDKYLFIGTRKGLNRFNITTEKFERYLPEKNKTSSILGENVWTIYPYKNDNLIIGTLGGGLSLTLTSAVKNSKLDFISFKHDPRLVNSLSHNEVWCVFVDRTGVIWVGTDLGINKYDPEREKFSLLKNDPFNQNSISNNQVIAIHKDKSNILWVGTRNGLNKIDLNKNKVIRFFVDSNTGLTNNYIRAIYRLKNGKLLIGTNGGGLLLFDELKNKFIKFNDFYKIRSLSSENITSICEDDNNVLWIGTLGGVNKFNLKTNELKIYLNDKNVKNSLSHDYVSSIFYSKKGNLLIATLGGGINLYDPVNDNFINFSENPSDSNSLSNNTVWTIYEDSKSNLWIGTNNGLNYFDFSKKQFTYIDEKYGLEKNAIYGILEDSQENLWLSSNNGIIKFNPVTKEKHYYTTGDGLQSKQFTGNAYFKDENSTMYFGGINGLNYFNPKYIVENKIVPTIAITDFQIFNKSVQIGNNSPLKKSISETKEIILSANQNVFSFEFAALHYSNPKSNQYSYIMEGFDKDWILAGTRRFVTYTNLDAGKYVFHVIGSNNDGLWNKEGVSIAIIIEPPFYRSWWFITLTLISVFIIIGTIVYLRLKQILEIERLRVEIAADLHDDIGTRLTEISLLSDILYHDNNSNIGDEEKETIKKIGRISRTLIENMSEIVWLINPKRDSLYELFLKLKDNYDELLSKVQINLHINNLENLEKIKLPMEYRKNVYLIFKEALNNSIKYSGCNEISINADVDKSTLIILMYDNGKGFDLNKKSNGNGLSNMQKRAKDIGGELRINSKVGEGTMIRFTGKIK